MRTAQDSWDRTARTGQPEHDNRTERRGWPEHDSTDRIAVGGQPGQDDLGYCVAGQPRQDTQGRIMGTGQLRQISWGRLA